MSLTEEARTPFSLVDEINQVGLVSPPTHDKVSIDPLGNGPACGTRGAQFDGRGDVQA